MATAKKKAVKKRATKRIKATKRPILEMFLQALTELYPKDAVAPGLSIACLPGRASETGACYYVSVVRYEGSAPTSAAAHNLQNYKQVLYKATGPTLKAAVTSVISQWLQATKAVQALRSGKEL